MWVVGLEALIVSALAAWLITPVTLRLAHRLGAVDLPGPRKVNSSPIPRIGGIAVFGGFVVGLGFAAAASGFLTNEHHLKARYWTTLSVAAAAMLVLGVIDDIRGLSFKVKFAAQIGASIAIWCAGFRIQLLSFPNVGFELAWVSLLITVLWVVGITNAFNLIDGLDGLAAGTALITTATVAVIAAVGDRTAVAAISICLAGSLVGFLQFNFNPARVFLGDSGSMFLGFTLAVISIYGSQKNVTAVAVLAPLLVLGYPILDTSFAVARRLNTLRMDSVGQGGVKYVARNISRVFLPDRGHLHHRLLDVGLSHRSAVLALYAVAVLMAAGALAVVVMNSVAVALLTLATLLVLTAGLGLTLFLRVRLMTRRRAAEQAAASPRPPSRSAVVPGGPLSQT
jgi:UDP-GlcNAc:undecaprenyl-phosphate GlcNAc-1-phosphate transferase